MGSTKVTLRDIAFALRSSGSGGTSSEFQNFEFNGGQGWNLTGPKCADLPGFFALTGNSVALEVALLLELGRNSIPELAVDVQYR